MLEVDDATLWRLLLTLLMVPDPRNKLPQYNTVDQAVKLISDARNIVVLTGAGVRTLRPAEFYWGSAQSFLFYWDLGISQA